MRNFLIFLLSCFSFTGFSQIIEKHSRANINLIGRDINDLSSIGIEVDHGILSPGKHFVSDFSMSEIDAIKKIGFEVDILIDDVATYYANPNRKSELDKYNYLAGKGLDCSGLNINYDYKTPVNYQDGSMGGYFKYSELLSILNDMAAKYPSLITVSAPIDSLKTHEGREILFVKVSDNPNVDEDSEPQVLYTAVHHAREPNGMSQMVFYLWYLLENYETDNLVKQIVDNTEMYFVPCLNPDGYIINETNKPSGGGLWRKNGYKNATGDVVGVDLNRNYGYAWGIDNTGSSPNPSSATYRGTEPFSEPETKALRNFCNKKKFKIALNYHTFGNYLIHPWGFNDQATTDDLLFKSIGKVLNKENNFLLGTGTETVGYTVNGDSDDWMYGEDITKPAIYAMTPEVGYSFWPAQTDIDFLNRSCVWMNLSTALVTLNYYGAEEVFAKEYLSPQQSKIFVKVNRAGLKDGSTVVSLVSNTAGTSVIDPIRQLTLSMGKDTIIAFDVNVDASQNYPSGINLILSVNSDNKITQTSINKEWINEVFQLVYYNACNDLADYLTSEWNTTNEISFSAPTCITDSPNIRYANSNFSSISTFTDISLKNASNAYLSFRARWDIEKGYDYVQVLGSKDNVDFIPLCGLYTTIGSASQAFNSPVYDGQQSEWVLEEISLDPFLGEENIYIKFEMYTDQGSNGDGFYFDDLLVNASFKPSSTDGDKHDMNIAVSPSLVKSGETMTILATSHEISNRSTLTIQSANGKLISLQKYSPNINLSSDLTPGMYILTLLSTDGKISSTKFAVIE